MHGREALAGGEDGEVFYGWTKFAGSVFGRVHCRELSNSFSFKLSEDCRVREVASIKVIVASKCDPLPC